MKFIYRKIKYILRLLNKKDIYVKKDVNLMSERFGSKYGGWHILPEYLNGSSIVYSFGVGTDASFEKAIHDTFGCRPVSFDPTPQSIQWVEAMICKEFMDFHPFGLHSEDGVLEFFPPENSNYVSHSAIRNSTDQTSFSFEVRRLSTVMSFLHHDRIDVLKMDIEGSEYKVLEDILSTSIRPKQLLVEFHQRFDPSLPAATKALINKIKDNGYSLFYKSPTNEEFSFVYLTADISA